MNDSELAKGQTAPLDKNIFLIGFMGTGKSAVSAHLSSLYRMDIVDMDQIIVRREGMSIPDIFDTHGEEYFRDLETDLLIKMQTRKNTIVSCGGGVPLRAQNIAEMKKSGRIFLLTATPQTILERVNNNDERPLLSGNKNLEFIEKLMEERRSKYEAAADVIIHTDEKSISEVCREILEHV